MRKLTHSEMAGQIIIHVIFIFIAICCLYPILLTLMVSFTSEASVVRNGMQLIPEEFSLDAYRFVFQDSSVYSGYLVTIIVTIVGTALSILVCGMAGFAMSIQNLQYKNIIAFIFYIPTVFSAGLLPWYLVCTQLYQLTDKPYALIVPMLVSPFNIFLCRNYFKTIPSSLVESAQIDGCGAMKTLFVIILPLAVPIIATIGLFIGLGFWNDWGMALWFINDTRLYPLQYMLFRIQSIMDHIRQHGSMGNTQIPSQTYQIATLFVTIGPIVLLYPFVQRYFVKGIMVGAVKG